MNHITQATQNLTTDFIPFWDESLTYENQKWNFEIVNEANAIRRQELQDVIDTYIMRSNHTMVNQLSAELHAIEDVPVVDPKPTLAEVQAECDRIQAELDAAEAARLAEEARVQDIKDRWALAMEDMHGTWKETGRPHEANPALHLKRIIEEDDQVFLAELEAANTTRKNKADKLNARRALKDSGNKKLLVCSEILNLIRGANSEEGKTEAEIDAMEAQFADIVNALEKGRPSKAKRLIDLVTDPTVADLKVLILEEFAEHGY